MDADGDYSMDYTVAVRIDEQTKLYISVFKLGQVLLFRDHHCMK